MNKENFLKVADAIEQLPHKFDMLSPASPYGSQPGSIIGFAKGVGRLGHTGAPAWLGLTHPQERSLTLGGSIWAKYADELGIENDPRMGMVNLKFIKPHHAVTMLRNLANGTWSFGNE